MALAHSLLIPARLDRSRLDGAAGGTHLADAPGPSLAALHRQVAGDSRGERALAGITSCALRPHRKVWRLPTREGLLKTLLPPALLRAGTHARGVVGASR